MNCDETIFKAKANRKARRIWLSNTCTITIKDSAKSFLGKLDNLSANGFAFVATDDFFFDCKGQNVVVTIDDFALPEHNVIEGRIIRSSSWLPDAGRQLRNYGICGKNVVEIIV